MTPTLGIVGGMGPLASAAFLSTLYELTVDGAEQSAPACILLSNPAVPDRTESVLGGRGEAVLSPLRTALETLCRTYWYPLYAYLRRQGRAPHDAQDLTQGFFARLLEKGYLQSAARENGRR